MFEKAVRKKSKLRLGLCAPSGAGKTYSALLLAKGLGGKIALIDTENGSASLYSHLVDFDVCNLEAPYTVDKYLKAIEYAENNGYNTIIIDSLSHCWAGEGGLLEQQGIASKRTGNSYTAWRDITPLHNRLIDAIVNSKCHIIATMRSKVDYVLEINDKGKQTPKKVGLAPVQREGMDYEFTTVFDIDIDTHTAKSSKDRTGLFDDKIIKINEETGTLLNEWLNQGVDIPMITPEQEQKLEELGVDKIALCTFFKVNSVKDLTFKQAQMAISKKEQK